MQEVNIKWQDCKTAPLCGKDLLVTDGTYIEAAYAYAIHGGKIGGMSGSPLKRVKNITAWAYAEVETEQLSDLEIVQKALEKTDLELRVGKDWIALIGEDNYSAEDLVEVYYRDWNSLLTWAKQTIEGVE